MDVRSVERLLSDLGDGIRYMTAGEYCAYLHAKVERDGPALVVDYDDHYCRHFASRASSWTLHLSDQTRRALKEPVPEKRVIEIPKGTGRHRVSLASR